MSAIAIEKEGSLSYTDSQDINPNYQTETISESLNKFHAIFFQCYYQSW